MRSIVDQYKACVETTAAIDYSSPASVRRNNRAVDRMYAIVRSVEQQGCVDELLPLLDDARAAPWLAHQLVEAATIDDATRTRCIAIVTRLAVDDGSPEALGEKLWLERWSGRGR